RTVGRPRTPADLGRLRARTVGRPRTPADGLPAGIPHPAQTCPRADEGACGLLARISLFRFFDVGALRNSPGEGARPARVRGLTTSRGLLVDRRASAVGRLRSYA